MLISLENTTTTSADDFAAAFVPAGFRYRIVCVQGGRRIETAMTHETPVNLVKLAQRLNRRFPTRHYTVEPEKVTA